jgi:Glycosyl hydrolase family 26
MSGRKASRGGAMIAIAVAVSVLVGIQANVTSARPPRAVGPWPVPPPSSASVDLGVTTLPLARNSWRAWRPSDLASVNAFEHGIRKHVSVVMWYVDWAHQRPLQEQLAAVASRGSVPEITWEPWDSTRPVRTQPRFALRRIIAGRFDPYLHRFAAELAAYGQPVRLRFAQEMNGSWYPWSEAANGNHANEFVRAWRHIHDVFDEAGASNVQWVWSPAAIAITREQYPGDAYVDWVSLSLFNGGSQLRYDRWRPFSQLVKPSVARLRSIAPGKPIELSEVGCAARGGDKAAWITGMFAALARDPGIESLIWYDLVKGSDWRVESSRRSIEAFATAAADPRYR